MNLNKAKLEDFLKIIDSCEGAVTITTDEGDVINLKSKLSQIVGITKLIVDGQVSVTGLDCEKNSDYAKFFRYALYHEVPK